MFFHFSCIHFAFIIDQPSFSAYFPLLPATVTTALSQIGFCITVCPSSFQLSDPKQPDRKEQEAYAEECWFQTLSINFTFFLFQGACKHG